jgi:hypothetical protein
MDTGHEAFHLVFEDHPGYFFACVEAHTLTERQVAQYQHEIARAIIKRRSPRVMIKRDVPHTRSSAELYQIPAMVDDLNALNIKYAFVDVVPDDLNTYKLALLDAKNRGLQIAVFGDISAAEKWLLDD